MPSEDERFQRKVEEQFNQSNRSGSGCGWIAVATVLLPLILLIGNAIRQSSAPKDATPTLEGSQARFTGVVVETGISSASNRLYFVVAAEGKTVKCYSDAPVRERDYVRITGTISVWSESGGSFNPCALDGPSF